MRLKEIVEILQKKYKKMLLSKAETAIELNVSQTTIDRFRKQGIIKSKKMGGQIFFTLSTVAEFLAE